MLTKTYPVAKIEPFDSFWEAPEDIEKGYSSFGAFYKYNYLKRMPRDKQAKILIISCGPGYMVNLLNQEGFSNVLGIDSSEEKIQYAKEKNLNSKVARAFDFLQENQQPYDVIFCEQEINHLSKDEILAFLRLCHKNLRLGGNLIVHSLNGANPIVGVENLALNFDHYNLFTEKSLEQILEYSNFENITIFPLKLYIFYNNPLNYVGLTLDALLNLIFRLIFIFYGKSNRIFSKKVGAICRKAY
jgi:SAM-dependent methyltransferase